MREQNSYSESASLTVGTPNTNMINDLPVAGFMATATVAGNATVTLTGGGQVTVNLPVGTTVLPLAVLTVNSQTATATYWQLA